MKFENPAGDWSYEGAFSVLLCGGTPTNNVPVRAKIIGQIVRVDQGNIQRIQGKIQFNAYGQDFSWKNRQIISIFDGDGNSIWENPYYH